jgi:hypothetical protein
VRNRGEVLKPLTMTAAPEVKQGVLQTLLILVFCLYSAGVATGQEAPKFGGRYADLDARRQALISDWVDRFGKVTGQQLPAGP